MKTTKIAESMEWWCSKKVYERAELVSKHQEILQSTNISTISCDDIYKMFDAEQFNKS